MFTSSLYEVVFIEIWSLPSSQVRLRLPQYSELLRRTLVRRRTKTVTGTNQIDAVCVSVIKQNGILPLLYPARNHRVHQNRLKAIAHQKYGVSQLPMIDRISLKYLG